MNDKALDRYAIPECVEDWAGNCFRSVWQVLQEGGDLNYVQNRVLYEIEVHMRGEAKDIANRIWKAITQEVEVLNDLNQVI